MFIEVSGLQQVGKTTLIKKLPNYFFTYKFPFTDIYKGLDFKNEWEFCQTKDITMLDISNTLNVDIISDRGPLSSVFYCLLRNKCNKHQAQNFLEFILEKYENWNPSWIWTDNNQNIGKRNRNDSYDDLENFDKSYITDVKNHIFNIVRRRRTIHTFYNDFKKPIDLNALNFQKFINGVKNENYLRHCCRKY